MTVTTFNGDPQNTGQLVGLDSGGWDVAHDKDLGNLGFNVSIGQAYAYGLWYCYRTPLYWDTSSLAGSTILSAHLDLHCDTKAKAVGLPDYNVVVVPGTGLVWGGSNYYTLTNYGVMEDLTTTLASKAYADITDDTDVQLDLNSTGLNLISKSGHTVFCLRGSLDISRYNVGNNNYSVNFGVVGGDLVVTHVPSSNVYPTSAMTRVSSLTHRFAAGKNGNPGTYLLEIGLGGLSSQFIPPVEEITATPSIPDLTTGKWTQHIFKQPGRSYASGPTLNDYAQWLSTRTEKQIKAIFGDWPTFNEWSAWMSSQK